MGYFYVFLGGGLGSICRWALSQYNDSMPYGTLLANYISCFILGALLAYSIKYNASDSIKLVLMTGFCGGFSTFSTFSVEVFKQLQAEAYLQALTYGSLSLIGGLACVILGYYLLIR